MSEHFSSLVQTSFVSCQCVLIQFGGPHIVPPTPSPTHSQLVSHHTCQTPSENRAHGKGEDVVLEFEGGKRRVPGRTGRGGRPNCLSSSLAGVVVSNVSLAPWFSSPLRQWGGVGLKLLPGMGCIPTCSSEDVG